MYTHTKLYTQEVFKTCLQTQTASILSVNTHPVLWNKKQTTNEEQLLNHKAYMHIFCLKLRNMNFCK